MSWYEIKNADEVDSPALLVYPRRIHENIDRLIRMVDGRVERLRPHVKTNKMAEVCQAMIDRGITRFKCATIAEAEMLAMTGAADVLLAYQPVGPKIGRLLQLVEKYPSTHFSCLVDHAGAATALSAACVDGEFSLDIFIDLNTGMNRTGIEPRAALELFEAVHSLPALTVVGVHAYDGHIRESDLAVRRSVTASGFVEVDALVAKMQAFSRVKYLLVAGGSPTFPIHAQSSDSQCSPGTFVFWDWSYKHNFPDEPFDYAALVMTRVISIVNEHTITTDLGHKSVAAENPLPRVHFLNAPEASPIGQSEEHLVLKVPTAVAYNPGDILYGVPVHICPTVALYDHANVIEDNQATGQWRVIARDRFITI